MKIEQSPAIAEENQVAITSRQAELTRLEGDLVEQRPQAEAARGAVEAHEGRRRTLQTEFDGLAGYSEIDTSRQADVQGLVARREDLVFAAHEREPTAAPAAPGPTGPDRSRTSLDRRGSHRRGLCRGRSS